MEIHLDGTVLHPQVKKRGKRVKQSERGLARRVIRACRAVLLRAPMHVAAREAEVELNRVSSDELSIGPVIGDRLLFHGVGSAARKSVLARAGRTVQRLADRVVRFVIVLDLAAVSSSPGIPGGDTGTWTATRLITDRSPLRRQGNVCVFCRGEKRRIRSERSSGLTVRDPFTPTGFD